MKVIVNDINKLEKAYEVIVAGADGVGVSLDRNIDKMKDLVYYLPPVSTSVLTADEVTPMSIINDVKTLNVTTLILNGDIFIEDINLIREKLPYLKIIKKISVTDKDSLKEAIKYKKSVDAILINTDIMDNEKLKVCLDIIDECDYVLMEVKATKDFFAVIKELNPYGIVISYENERLKEFIKAIKNTSN